MSHISGLTPHQILIRGLDLMSYSAMSWTVKCIITCPTREEFREKVTDECSFIVTQFGGWELLHSLDRNTLYNLLPEMRRYMILNRTIEQEAQDEAKARKRLEDLDRIIHEHEAFTMEKELKKKHKNAYEQQIKKDLENKANLHSVK